MGGPALHLAARAKRRLALGVLAVAGSFPASTCAGLHSGPEYDALVALYASANGSNWTTRTNWGSGDACQWFDVTCDQDADASDNTSHVTTIDMTDNNMTGTLAPIGALAYLQVFDVGSNRLTGGVPAISGMHALRNFYVYSNLLTGTLPDLSDLPALIVFDADSNALTGTIPALNSLGALITFNVSANALSGSMPDLTGLGNLSYLALSRNRLSGTIPSLPAGLHYFYAAWNRLSGAVPNPPVGLSSASLCPNLLDTTPQPFDAVWNAATGNTPWWATPFATNRCDEIYFGEFD